MPLTDFDSLTHRERVRALVDIGRRSMSDAALQGDIVAARGSHDTYQRTLALTTAFGSRDPAGILAGLRDPSRTVRRRALKWVPIVLDNAGAAEALTLIHGSRTRAGVARRLMRVGKTAAIDALIDAELKRAQPRGGELDLLGFASAECVARRFATAEPLLSPIGWRRLATYHGALVVERLQATVKKQLDPRQLWRLHAVVPVLAKHHPAPTLELVDRMLETGERAFYGLGPVLTELVRRLPRETFDVLLKHRHAARRVTSDMPFSLVRFDGVAHRLDADRLRDLIRYGASALRDRQHGRRWFLKLSEDQRRAVLEAWMARQRDCWGGFLFRYVTPEQSDAVFPRWSAAAQDQHGVIARSLLDWLPAPLRIREARRHLELKWLINRPAERMPYASLLPFDAAAEALAAWLGHPEPEMRQPAIAALVGTAQFDPAALTPAIEAIAARRFEQDPVRGAMLAALLGVPVKYVTKSALPALGDVLQHALDAADLSASTASVVERIVLHLVGVDATWAAQWFMRLTKARNLTAGRLSVAELSPAQLSALAQALGPVIAQWQRNEKAGAVLQLAGALRSRLGAIEPLLDALSHIATHHRDSFEVRGALALLRQHAPRRFSALAAELFETDPSFVHHASIARWLSCYRQDLLTTALKDSAMQGRFASKKTAWTIAFEIGHGTWNAAQQQRHAALIERVIGHDATDTPTARSLVTELSRLAFAPEAALIGFASDPRPPVREVAIRALPHLDGPEGVTALLECLGDARARYAIYALRAALKEQSAAQVVDTLNRAPMKQVTVAKEVVRLLGEYGEDAGYERLVAMADESLHRDVRIALLRSLWQFLDRSATWEIFEAAITDPDWVVANRLADVPYTRLTREAERRLTQILARLLKRPEPEARLDLLRRAAHLPLSDADRHLFRACLSHFDAPDHEEAAAAVPAVMRRMKPAETGDVADAILAQRSRWQTFDALVTALEPWLGHFASKSARKVAKQVLDALADDTERVAMFVRLAGLISRAPALAKQLMHVSDQKLLHFDAMTAAAEAIERTGSAHAIHVLFEQHADPRIRRLGVAALRRAAQKKNGWTTERREALARYQSDADPLVRSAALVVFPAPG